MDESHNTAGRAAGSGRPAAVRKRHGNERSVKARSIEAIYERVYVAILEHRLKPGTKLGEDRLAGIFGVSRARIREVLAWLAHEGIVELFPQKGARVARPTPQQAREIFEMRRLIEPGIVQQLVRALSPEMLARLHEHLARELDARRRADQRSVIRLSGEFHLLLAELVGNRFLVRNMRELSTLTCLIIFLYDSSTADSCREDEHAEIVEAIADADADRASALMLGHLDHIETSLNLAAAEGDDVDLEAIFAD